MPIFNKIHNVCRASRKLRPGLRISERCKSSRFANARRSQTCGDVSKQGYQKEVPCSPRIHSKIRIEEPETGLVLNVKVIYFFRKIPSNGSLFYGEIDGNKNQKNIIRNSRKMDVWRKIDEGPAELNHKQYLMSLQQTKAPSLPISVGDANSQVTKHLDITESNTESNADIRKYNTKVRGKIEVSAPRLNNQQLFEVIQGVLRNLLTSSLNSLLRKAGAENGMENFNIFNPPKRAINVDNGNIRREQFSKRNTSEASFQKIYNFPQTSATVLRKLNKPEISLNNGNGQSKGNWKNSSEVIQIKPSRPKGTSLKAEQCCITISMNKIGLSLLSSNTTSPLSKTMDTPALASMHISPSSNGDCSKKDRKFPSEVPPLYYIVPKLKERENFKQRQFKSSNQNENAKDCCAGIQNNLLHSQQTEVINKYSNVGSQNNLKESSIQDVIIDHPLSTKADLKKSIAPSQTESNSELPSTEESIKTKSDVTSKLVRSIKESFKAAVNAQPETKSPTEISTESNSTRNEGAKRLQAAKVDIQRTWAVECDSNYQPQRVENNVSRRKVDIPSVSIKENAPFSMEVAETSFTQMIKSYSNESKDHHNTMLRKNIVTETLKKIQTDTPNTNMIAQNSRMLEIKSAIDRSEKPEIKATKPCYCTDTTSKSEPAEQAAKPNDCNKFNNSQTISTVSSTGADKTSSQSSKDCPINCSKYKVSKDKPSKQDVKADTNSSKIPEAKATNSCLSANTAFKPPAEHAAKPNDCSKFNTSQTTAIAPCSGESSQASKDCPIDCSKYKVAEEKSSKQELKAATDCSKKPEAQTAKAKEAAKPIDCSKVNTSQAPASGVEKAIPQTPKHPSIDGSKNKVAEEKSSKQELKAATDCSKKPEVKTAKVKEAAKPIDCSKVNTSQAPASGVEKASTQPPKHPSIDGSKFNVSEDKTSKQELKAATDSSKKPAAKVTNPCDCITSTCKSPPEHAAKPNDSSKFNTSQTTSIAPCSGESSQASKDCPIDCSKYKVAEEKSSKQELKAATDCSKKPEAQTAKAKEAAKPIDCSKVNTSQAPASGVEKASPQPPKHSSIDCSKFNVSEDKTSKQELKAATDSSKKPAAKVINPCDCTTTTCKSPAEHAAKPNDCSKFNTSQTTSIAPCSGESSQASKDCPIDCSKYKVAEEKSSKQELKAATDCSKKPEAKTTKMKEAAKPIDCNKVNTSQAPASGVEKASPQPPKHSSIDCSKFNVSEDKTSKQELKAATDSSKKPAAKVINPCDFSTTTCKSPAEHAAKPNDCSKFNTSQTTSIDPCSGENSQASKDCPIDCSKYKVAEEKSSKQELKAATDCSKKPEAQTAKAKEAAKPIDCSKVNTSQAPASGVEKASPQPPKHSSIDCSKFNVSEDKTSKQELKAATDSSKKPVAKVINPCDFSTTTCKSPAEHAAKPNDCSKFNTSQTTSIAPCSGESSQASKDCPIDCSKYKVAEEKSSKQELKAATDCSKKPEAQTAKAKEAAKPIDCSKVNTSQAPASGVEKASPQPPKHSSIDCSKFNVSEDKTSKQELKAATDSSKKPAAKVTNPCDCITSTCKSPPEHAAKPNDSSKFNTSQTTSIAPCSGESSQASKDCPIDCSKYKVAEEKSSKQELKAATDCSKKPEAQTAKAKEAAKPIDCSKVNTSQAPASGVEKASPQPPKHSSIDCSKFNVSEDKTSKQELKAATDSSKKPAAKVINPCDFSTTTCKSPAEHAAKPNDCSKFNTSQTTSIAPCSGESSQASKDCPIDCSKYKVAEEKSTKQELKAATDCSKKPEAKTAKAKEAAKSIDCSKVNTSQAPASGVEKASTQPPKHPSIDRSKFNVSEDKTSKQELKAATDSSKKPAAKVINPCDCITSTCKSPPEHAAKPNDSSKFNTSQTTSIAPCSGESSQASKDCPIDCSKYKVAEEKSTKQELKAATDCSKKPEAKTAKAKEAAKSIDCSKVNTSQAPASGVEKASSQPPKHPSIDGSKNKVAEEKSSKQELKAATDCSKKPEAKTAKVKEAAKPIDCSKVNTSQAPASGVEKASTQPPKHSSIDCSKFNVSEDKTSKQELKAATDSSKKPAAKVINPCDCTTTTCKSPAEHAAKPNDCSKFNTSQTTSIAPCSGESSQASKDCPIDCSKYKVAEEKSSKQELKAATDCSKKPEAQTAKAKEAAKPIDCSKVNTSQAPASGVEKASPQPPKHSSIDCSKFNVSEDKTSKQELKAATDSSKKPAAKVINPCDCITSTCKSPPEHAAKPNDSSKFNTSQTTSIAPCSGESSQASKDCPIDCSKYKVAEEKSTKQELKAATDCSKKPEAKTAKAKEAAKSIDCSKVNTSQAPASGVEKASSQPPKHPSIDGSKNKVAEEKSSKQELKAATDCSKKPEAKTAKVKEAAKPIDCSKVNTSQAPASGVEKASTQPPKHSSIDCSKFNVSEDKTSKQELKAATDSSKKPAAKVINPCDCTTTTCKSPAEHAAKPNDCSKFNTSQTTSIAPCSGESSQASKDCPIDCSKYKVAEEKSSKQELKAATDCSKKPEAQTAKAKEAAKPIDCSKVNTSQAPASGVEKASPQTPKHPSIDGSKNKVAEEKSSKQELKAATDCSKKPEAKTAKVKEAAKPIDCSKVNTSQAPASGVEKASTQPPKHSSIDCSKFNVSEDKTSKQELKAATDSSKKPAAKVINPCDCTTTTCKSPAEHAAKPNDCSKFNTSQTTSIAPCSGESSQASKDCPIDCSKYKVAEEKSSKQELKAATDCSKKPEVKTAKVKEAAKPIDCSMVNTSQAPASGVEKASTQPPKHPSIDGSKFNVSEDKTSKQELKAATDSSKKPAAKVTNPCDCITSTCKSPPEHAAKPNDSSKFNTSQTTSIAPCSGESSQASKDCPIDCSKYKVAEEKSSKQELKAATDCSKKPEAQTAKAKEAAKPIDCSKVNTSQAPASGVEKASPQPPKHSSIDCSKFNVSEDKTSKQELKAATDSSKKPAAKVINPCDCTTTTCKSPAEHAAKPNDCSKFNTSQTTSIAPCSGESSQASKDCPIDCSKYKVAEEKSSKQELKAATDCSKKPEAKTTKMKEAAKPIDCNKVNTSQAPASGVEKASPQPPKHSSIDCSKFNVSEDKTSKQELKAATDSSKKPAAKVINPCDFSTTTCKSPAEHAAKPNDCSKFNTSQTTSIAPCSGESSQASKDCPIDCSKYKVAEEKSTKQELKAATDCSKKPEAKNAKAKEAAKSIDCSKVNTSQAPASGVEKASTQPPKHPSIDRSKFNVSEDKTSKQELKAATDSSKKPAAKVINPCDFSTTTCKSPAEHAVKPNDSSKFNTSQTTSIAPCSGESSQASKDCPIDCSKYKVAEEKSSKQELKAATDCSKKPEAQTAKAKEAAKPIDCSKVNTSQAPASGVEKASPQPPKHSSIDCSKFNVSEDKTSKQELKAATDSSKKPAAKVINPCDCITSTCKSPPEHAAKPNDSSKFNTSQTTSIAPCSGESSQASKDCPIDCSKYKVAEEKSTKQELKAATDCSKKPEAKTAKAKEAAKSIDCSKVNTSQAPASGVEKASSQPPKHPSIDRSKFNVSEDKTSKQELKAATDSSKKPAAKVINPCDFSTTTCKSPAEHAAKPNDCSKFNTSQTTSIAPCSGESSQASKDCPIDCSKYKVAEEKSSKQELKAATDCSKKPEAQTAKAKEAAKPIDCSKVNTSQAPASGVEKASPQTPKHPSIDGSKNKVAEEKSSKQELKAATDCSKKPEAKTAKVKEAAKPIDCSKVNTSQAPASGVEKASTQPPKHPSIDGSKNKVAEENSSKQELKAATDCSKKPEAKTAKVKEAAKPIDCSKVKTSQAPASGVEKASPQPPKHPSIDGSKNKVAEEKSSKQELKAATDCSKKPEAKTAKVKEAAKPIDCSKVNTSQAPASGVEKASPQPPKHPSIDGFKNKVAEEKSSKQELKAATDFSKKPEAKTAKVKEAAKPIDCSKVNTSQAPASGVEKASPQPPKHPSIDGSKNKVAEEKSSKQELKPATDCSKKPEAKTAKVKEAAKPIDCSKFNTSQAPASGVEKASPQPPEHPLIDGSKYKVAEEKSSKQELKAAIDCSKKPEAKTAKVKEAAKPIDCSKVNTSQAPASGVEKASPQPPKHPLIDGSKNKVAEEKSSKQELKAATDCSKKPEAKTAKVKEAAKPIDCSKVNTSQAPASGVEKASPQPPKHPSIDASKNKVAEEKSSKQELKAATDCSKKPEAKTAKVKEAAKPIDCSKFNTSQAPASGVEKASPQPPKHPLIDGSKYKVAEEKSSKQELKAAIDCSKKPEAKTAKVKEAAKPIDCSKVNTSQAPASGVEKASSQPPKHPSIDRSKFNVSEDKTSKQELKAATDSSKKPAAKVINPCDFSTTTCKSPAEHAAKPNDCSKFNTSQTTSIAPCSGESSQASKDCPIDCSKYKVAEEKSSKQELKAATDCSKKPEAQTAKAKEAAKPIDCSKVNTSQAPASGVEKASPQTPKHPSIDGSKNKVAEEKSSKQELKAATDCSKKPEAKTAKVKEAAKPIDCSKVNTSQAPASGVEKASTQPPKHPSIDGSKNKVAEENSSKQELKAATDCSKKPEAKTAKVKEAAKPIDCSKVKTSQAPASGVEKASPQPPKHPSIDGSKNKVAEEKSSKQELKAATDCSKKPEAKTAKVKEAAKPIDCSKVNTSQAPASGVEKASPQPPKHPSIDGFKNKVAEEKSSKQELKAATDFSKKPEAKTAKVKEAAKPIDCSKVNTSQAPASGVEKASPQPPKHPSIDGSKNKVAEEKSSKQELKPATDCSKKPEAKTAKVKEAAKPIDCSKFNTSQAPASGVEKASPQPPEHPLIDGSKYKVAEEKSSKQELKAAIDCSKKPEAKTAKVKEAAKPIDCSKVNTSQAPASGVEKASPQPPKHPLIDGSKNKVAEEKSSKQELKAATDCSKKPEAKTAKVKEAAKPIDCSKVNTSQAPASGVEKASPQPPKHPSIDASKNKVAEEKSSKQELKAATDCSKKPEAKTAKVKEAAKPIDCSKFNTSQAPASGVEKASPQPPKHPLIDGSKYKVAEEKSSKQELKAAIDCSKKPEAKTAKVKEAAKPIDCSKVNTSQPPASGVEKASPQPPKHPLIDGSKNKVAEEKSSKQELKAATDCSKKPEAKTAKVKEAAKPIDCSKVNTSQAPASGVEKASPQPPKHPLIDGSKNKVAEEKSSKQELKAATDCSKKPEAKTAKVKEAAKPIVCSKVNTSQAPASGVEKASSQPPKHPLIDCSKNKVAEDKSSKQDSSKKLETKATKLVDCVDSVSKTSERKAATPTDCSKYKSSEVSGTVTSKTSKKNRTGENCKNMHKHEHGEKIEFKSETVKSSSTEADSGIGSTTVVNKAKTPRRIDCSKDSYGHSVTPEKTSKETQKSKAGTPGLCIKHLEAERNEAATLLKAKKQPAMPYNCCLKIIGQRQVQVENCPMPPLDDDCVVIKMHSVGLCNSDIYMFEKGIQKIDEYGVSLGHEGAGEIVEIGEKVTTLQKGDRVCIEAGVPCARCKYCQIGRYNICPYMKYSGLLATYCRHPARLCHKIPRTMKYEEAALVHPLSLGLQACDRGHVTVGSKVLILGACPLGLSSVIAARAMGADKIAIIDVLERNLQVASELRADICIVASSSMLTRELVEKVLSEMKCRPNVIIDCYGCTKTMKMAMDLADKGGVFVLAGCQEEKAEFSMLKALAKEICFHTSLRSSNKFAKAINMIATGKTQIGKMITHRTGFRETQKGFETALNEGEKGGAIKVMVNWSHAQDDESKC